MALNLNSMNNGIISKPVAESWAVVGTWSLWLSAYKRFGSLALTHYVNCLKYLLFGSEGLIKWHTGVVTQYSEHPLNFILIQIFGSFFLWIFYLFYQILLTWVLCRIQISNRFCSNYFNNHYLPVLTSQDMQRFLGQFYWAILKFERSLSPHTFSFLYLADLTSIFFVFSMHSTLIDNILVILQWLFENGLCNLGLNCLL